jgi:hypothetical protein
VALIRYNYRDGQNFFVWFLLSLGGIVIGVLSLCLSALRQDMIWRNIRYTFTGDGIVKSVEFLK